VPWCRPSVRPWTLLLLLLQPSRVCLCNKGYLSVHAPHAVEPLSSAGCGVLFCFLMAFLGRRTTLTAALPPLVQTHSHRSASSADVEVELPASPEAPLLGPSASQAHGGSSSAAPTPRLRLLGSDAKHEPAVHDASAAAAADGEEPAGGSSSLAPPGALEGVREVLRSRGFWRYLAMCFITGEVR
jgi:hypothetical protein